MKYCSHCGAEVNDEAVVCIKCGCSVSNTTNQVLGIVNPNDAPNKGFAVLGFFFPLVGFILWLVWNNSSPKKAKSCGIGALIGVIGIPIIITGIFFVLTFVVGSSVITYNIMNKGSKQQTVVSDPSSPYIGKKPAFSWYTDIGTVTAKTKDEQPHSVSVVMNIGYDTTDETAYSELSSKRLELQDFVRRYFSGKYAEELKPENEERLKQEIKETLNKRLLETARVRDITFTKFDVMEAF
jgi:flagellar FliL protein